VNAPAETLPDLVCIHADEALLVLDKPAGMLSVPGRVPARQDCAAHRAQARWADALVVHRLDMATSGLLLMARGAAMQRLLGRAFETRAVRKTYVAVVSGHLADEAGTIDAPLKPDWPQRPRQMVCASGKPSLTHWRVLERGHDAQGRPWSRLQLQPITGRSHQLRVHLLHIGHPILGDTLYADAETAARSARLLLHATTLALTHPLHGQPCSWHSPPPF
jgi:tRNA pseudouridine32 synthase/23S rRNA pseudouridine746 synthase